MAPDKGEAKSKTKGMRVRVRVEGYKGRRVKGYKGKGGRVKGRR